MYKKIVIPTDGSKPSKKAAYQGLKIAKALNTKVLALYVIDTTSFAAVSPDALAVDVYSLLERDSKNAVEYVKREGKKMGVKVEVKVVEGSPSEQIIKYGGKQSLIVMGTKGRTGLGRLLLGSVAENVVHHANCPVMVVRYED